MIINALQRLEPQKQHFYQTNCKILKLQSNIAWLIWWQMHGFMRECSYLQNIILWKTELLKKLLGVTVYTITLYVLAYLHNDDGNLKVIRLTLETYVFCGLDLFFDDHQWPFIMWYIVRGHTVLVQVQCYILRITLPIRASILQGVASYGVSVCSWPWPHARVTCRVTTPAAVLLRHPLGAPRCGMMKPKPHVWPPQWGTTLAKEGPQSTAAEDGPQSCQGFGAGLGPGAHVGASPRYRCYELTQRDSCWILD